MRTKVRFKNIKYSPTTSGRIKLLAKTLKPLSASCANVKVEIDEVEPSRFKSSVAYEDELGHLHSTSEKFDLWDSFYDSLGTLKDDLQRRENKRA